MPIRQTRHLLFSFKIHISYVKPAIHRPILQLPTYWRLLFQFHLKCSRYVYVLHQQLATLCVDIWHLKNRSADIRLTVGRRVVAKYLSAEKLLATKSRHVYDELKCHRNKCGQLSLCRSTSRAMVSTVSCRSTSCAMVSTVSC